MFEAGKLIAIGYWDGPQTGSGWPPAHRFVDAAWDRDDRDMVAEYVALGIPMRYWMGYSQCRFCGKNNGVSDRSDGVYIWPEGLTHYVTEHDVRLPDRFTEHVRTQIEAFEASETDASWWRSLR